MAALSGLVKRVAWELANRAKGITSVVYCDVLLLAHLETFTFGCGLTYNHCRFPRLRKFFLLVTENKAARYQNRHADYATHGLRPVAGYVYVRGKGFGGEVWGQIMLSMSESLASISIVLSTKSFSESRDMLQP